MMRTSFVPAAMAAATLIGCATAGTGASPEENQRVLVANNEKSAIMTSTDPSGVEMVIAAPADKVWDALMRAYPELGIEVLSINRPTGELGNRNFRVLHKLAGQPASIYFNCGIDILIGPQANSYPIDASLLTVIRADTAGTTHVESRLTGSARKIGVNADPLYCGSTGALERRLAEAARKRITP